MRKHVGIILGSTVASIVSVSLAGAQTVVTQPAPQQTTVTQTQPAQPSQTVVTQPAPPQTVVQQPAPAQQTNIVAAGPPARERAVSTGPNAMLLTNGLFTFGIPYGISVVVAAESSRDGDKNLFVPVAGPWIAYANEGSCPANEISCGRTTGAKVLLAADGILQAIGAIELVAAFTVPDSRTVASSQPKTRVMVAPSHVGRDGLGLAAAGTF
jgi:hypothetical protein